MTTKEHQAAIEAAVNATKEISEIKPLLLEIHKSSIARDEQQRRRTTKWIIGLCLDAFASLISVIAIFFTSLGFESIQAEIRASCSQDINFGSAPIGINPATGKASLLGVKIVTNARSHFFMIHCPGTLPPPDPSLKKWARYYHIPVAVSPSTLPTAPATAPTRPAIPGTRPILPAPPHRP